MKSARFLTFLIAAIGCSTATTTAASNLDIQGTWGGDNAGLIVNLDDVHIHIGCTLGDANGPIRTDANGRFEATGTYNVDAYPVNRGIEHPAKFSGEVHGLTMTLTVTLTDTARVLGPVTLVYGKQPQMGPCPICRVPKARTQTHQTVLVTAAADNTTHQAVLATARADNTTCDATLWQHVYKPKRLKIVEMCKSVTGVIRNVAGDDDGDMHAVLMLDPGQESLINKRNQKKKNGGLVIEIICSVAPKSPRAAVRACTGYRATLAMPTAGTHARVTGTYVIDTHNGWGEIHPVSQIELIK